MSVHVGQKTGRNDPCPCGSGKKYKRCCLAEQSASNSVWEQQRSACDELTGAMLRFAMQKFGDQIQRAWQDFHLTDLPLPYDPSSYEQQIFIPYFLFHWDPQRPRTGKKPSRRGGIVTRWYQLEKGASLSDMDRLVFEQATTQPVSFWEVLWSESGERIGLRDILIGTETQVIERSGSRTLQKGDIVYGQVWNLGTISILGCLAPTCIPPRLKGEVIELRRKLRRKIAKQNRDLAGEDLLYYADAIRLTYLTIREGLNSPPRLANTDGDPLMFHTLKFRIESPEKAFQVLAPLAFGESKEELLEDAEYGKDGKLQRIEFDWRKKGNAKISSWENTIHGNIKISGHFLVAEVNSENRAKRLRAEIETRLGPSATHQNTIVQTVDEMLAKAPKGLKAKEKKEGEFVESLLRDPDAISQIQAMIQRQAEDWVHQKIPALGGRTPLQAVRDPDGKEIVEALLLDWERSAGGGLYQAEIRPDFIALRRLLSLTAATP